MVVVVVIVVVFIVILWVVIGDFALCWYWDTLMIFLLYDFKVVYIGDNSVLYELR